jgi:aerobic carbon-monoxide dehydrogenase large subunit
MHDEPGLVGASRPRQAAIRLVAGKGQYTDDIAASRVANIVSLRSPHAHARCVSIDCEAASEAPGVIGVFRGADIAGISRP